MRKYPIFCLMLSIILVSSITAFARQDAPNIFFCKDHIYVAEAKIIV